MSAYRDYHRALLRRFDAYRTACHMPEHVFDPSRGGPNTPPVFRPEHAALNVITAPHAAPGQVDALLSLCPPGERHVWFRSMRSSQALTLSVLGNLATHNLLHLLADLPSDSGLSAFGSAALTPDAFRLEHRVNHLGERRSSSIDGFVPGVYQVAVECKFTEHDMGMCSRPRLPGDASNYARDYCDGTYTYQRGRQHRCSLAANGVLYWKYVPELFQWEANRDLTPCPLYANYQVVRNVLAAAVGRDGALTAGHALIIYDARNPAFRAGGAAQQAIVETQQALRDAARLRTLSWQAITARLRQVGALPWLTDALGAKYGL